MRTVITILSIFFCSITFGQNCNCDKDSLLNGLISCDTIKFDNKAKLFWSFNCDSSWLTYQNVHGKRTVIFSLGDGLVELTGRLGYIYAFEYDNTFLIQNNVISGCCSPPSYFLYDKTTGKLKSKLGRIIYYSLERSKPFIISVTDSNYDTTKSPDYKSLTVYNIDKDKRYFIELPEKQIENALDSIEKMYPEYLFDEPLLNGDILTLTYYVRKPKTELDRPIKTIIIDLKKYSS